MYPKSTCSYPEYAQSCAMLNNFYDEIKCCKIFIFTIYFSSRNDLRIYQKDNVYDNLKNI